MEKESIFEKGAKLLVLAIISVMIIYPFITVVATSLATQEEVTRKGGLIDSARIDGANDLKILTHIVLPLSGAVIAVVALFYAVAYWNAFFNAMLYLNNNSMWPLQLILRNYVVQGSPIPGSASPGDEAGLPPAEAMHMAVLVVALVPILLLYPFLQRDFTRGVLSGAIKG